MYRTATVSCYDVLDQVMVSAVVMEYTETPGTQPPDRIVFSCQVTGHGDDDVTIWLWRALQGLQAELDQGE